MNLLLTDNGLGVEYIRTICWTLIHSLWIGILAALFAVIALVFTKNKTAALRYNLLLGILFLFATGVLISFAIGINGMKDTITPVSAVSAPTVVFANNSQYQLPDEGTHSAGWLSVLGSFLNENARSVVLIWLFIIGIKCVQLFANLYSISRIHRHKILPAGDFWDDRLNILTLKMGMTRPMKLLQSGIAKVPMVVSYFKPVILVPAGLLTTLPQDEIEAVLLHELAHIRRNDFLVNIFQRLMEILFFFNPLLLWLSSRIREERENCCDDAAVVHLPKRSVFIQALISCQEFNLEETPRYALAFPGTKKHLLSRVERIVHKRNNAINGAEKIILSCCFPLMGLVLLFLLQAFQTKNIRSTDIFLPKNTQDIVMAATNNRKDTSKTSNKAIVNINGTTYNKYVFRRSGVLYEVMERGDKVESLIIDGRKASPIQLEKQLPELRKWMKECNDILAQPIQGLKNNVSGLNSNNSDHNAMAGIKNLAGLQRGIHVNTGDSLGRLNQLKGQTGTAPASLRELGGLKRGIVSQENIGLENLHHTSSYYDNGYKVVVADSIIVAVYFKGKRIPDEEIKDHKADVIPIVKGVATFRNNQ